MSDEFAFVVGKVYGCLPIYQLGEIGYLRFLESLDLIADLLISHAKDKARAIDDEIFGEEVSTPFDVRPNAER